MLLCAREARVDWEMYISASQKNYVPCDMCVSVFLIFFRSTLLLKLFRDTFRNIKFHENLLDYNSNIFMSRKES
jgi:hypothetical protein